jgi:hypothetical protein
LVSWFHCTFVIGDVESTAPLLKSNSEEQKQKLHPAMNSSAAAEGTQDRTDVNTVTNRKEELHDL